MLGSGTAKVRVSIAGGGGGGDAPGGLLKTAAKVAEVSSRERPRKQVASRQHVRKDVVLASAQGSRKVASAKSSRNVGGLLRAAPKVTQVAALQRARMRGTSVAQDTRAASRRGSGITLASASVPYAGVAGRVPGFME
jgi:hypothetical protein